MARVLVSTPLPGPALERLRAAHDVRVGGDPFGLGYDGLRAELPGFEAVIPLVTDRVDAALLDAAPTVRLVANFGVGVDNIDREACAARGVVVTNTPDVLTDATADLAFALLLGAARRVAEGDRRVRAGAWEGFAPADMLGVRVTGAQLGIVGLGRIGRAVAARARGFSMRVRYAQPRRAPGEVEAGLGAAHVELDELLRESDFVCVACPLDTSTRGLLSRERIATMRPGAVLVNIARGPIVDELAVAEALASGHLAAAGLDVYAREPRVPRELLDCPTAVLTPHIGSAEGYTRGRMADLAVDAVLDFFAGRPLRHRVA